MLLYQFFRFLPNSHDNLLNIALATSGVAGDGNVVNITIFHLSDHDGIASFPKDLMSSCMICLTDFKIINMGVMLLFP